MGGLKWYELLSLIMSIFSFFGFGVIIKNFWDDKHRQKLEQTAEVKEQKRKERQEAIREVFKEEIYPLTSDIKDVKENLAKNTEGTITLLRDRMKTALDRYLYYGYASSTEKANWHQLYNTYKQLGGNHFAEYVDEWKKAVDNLPTPPASKDVDNKLNLQ